MTTANDAPAPGVRKPISEMKVGDHVIADTHWMEDRYQRGVIVKLSPPGWVNYRNDADGEVWTTDPSNIRIVDAPAPAPSGSGVRVKELEWKRHPEDGSLTREGQGQQRDYVERALAPWGAYFLMVKDGRYSIKSSIDPFSDAPEFETPDEAKAAAQADYEARILSALASDAEQKTGPREEAGQPEIAIQRQPGWRRWREDQDSSRQAASVNAPRGEAPVAWREQDDGWRYYDRDSNADLVEHIEQHQKDRHGVSLFPLYAHPAPAAVEMLREAARDLIASRSSTYKAKNGRVMGIEDDSGEMMWIVPFDEMAALEAALAPATEGRKG